MWRYGWLTVVNAVKIMVTCLVPEFLTVFWFCFVFVFIHFILLSSFRFTDNCTLCRSYREFSDPLSLLSRSVTCPLLQYYVEWFQHPVNKCSAPSVHSCLPSFLPWSLWWPLSFIISTMLPFPRCHIVRIKEYKALDLLLLFRISI